MSEEDQEWFDFKIKFPKVAKWLLDNTEDVIKIGEIEMQVTLSDNTCDWRYREEHE